jgi:hypothetical protein
MVIDMPTVYRIAVEAGRGHLTVLKVLRGEKTEATSKEAVFAAMRRLGITSISGSNQPATALPLNIRS